MRDEKHRPLNPSHLILGIGGILLIGIVICIPLFTVRAAYSAPQVAGNPSIPNGLVSPDYFGPKIDAIAPYQPQTTCDNTDKSGLVAFKNLLLKVFPQTGDFGISTPCDGS